MKLRRFALHLSVLVSIWFLSFTSLVHADTSPAVTSPAGLLGAGLVGAGGSSGYQTTIGLSTFVGNLIKTVLGATGIIFIIIAIYAGILYMIASGDDTKVKKAKSMLVQAVIGLIIIVAAYSLTYYVVNNLNIAAGGTSTP